METISKSEQDGLAEMRSLITEFLNGREGSAQVREYMASVFQDDVLLLIYIKGRNYEVNHAWETLKYRAEVCFNEYPESFPESVPESALPLFQNGVMGLLKARDKFGRGIACFNAGKWKPSELSLDQITSTGTHLIDILLQNEDIMNNGLVGIQNCEGMGMRHIREYSLRKMLRLVNIFYYAYPVQLQGIYFLNVPVYAKFLFKILRPFLTKDLKEKFFLSTAGDKFDVLHEQLSPKILPKFLGGMLENEEAFDMNLLEKLKLSRHIQK